jgi:Zn-dependent protease with chaperone function
MLYLAIMISAVLIFTVPGKILALPNWANTLFVLTGGALGVGLGLLANFALGAYHLKKILPVTAIPAGPLRDSLAECFTRHGLAAPELWRVESERREAGMPGSRAEATAMIAGFNGGRWIFTPGLFISRGAIEALTTDQLRAVVLHEVSHLQLRHLRNRLLSSAALIVGLTVVATFCVFLSLVFLPEGPGRSLVSYAAAAGAMIVSFRGLSAQSRRHELEADRHAVLQLGADPDALGEALRKFDEINHSEGRRPGRVGTHPSTSARLQELEALRRRLQPAPSAPAPHRENDGDGDAGNRAA